VPLQTANDSQATGLPFSFTAPSPLTNGSVQLLLIGIGDNTVTSVTDSLGETWTLEDDDGAYGATGYAFVYRCDTSVSGSAPTITVHGTSVLAWTYCYVEDTLMAQGGPLVIGDNSGQGSVSASATTTAVPTNGNIGVGFCIGLQSDIAADTGETLTVAQPGVAFVDGGAGIIYQTATVDSTTFTASFLLDNFCNWAAIAIVYSPGSGGGGGGGPGDHPGLSGSGCITVSSPSALKLTLTGVPASKGQGLGNPARYFELGSISWGDGTFYSRNWYVEHEDEYVSIPIAGMVSVCYSFDPAITVDILEVP
jgi:hypothetical protein